MSLCDHYVCVFQPFCLQLYQFSFLLQCCYHIIFIEIVHSPNHEDNHIKSFTTSCGDALGDPSECWVFWLNYQAHAGTTSSACIRPYNPLQQVMQLTHFTIIYSQHPQLSYNSNLRLKHPQLSYKSTLGPNTHNCHTNPHWGQTPTTVIQIHTGAKHPQLSYKYTLGPNTHNCHTNTLGPNTHNCHTNTH